MPTTERSQPAQLAQGGYIARIELENFMCHRKFKIDLHNEMNIIVGRNGSGKSAILTALIVGLGGGARSTARGNSFRDLIRHGAQDAFITITVCNPAPLAPSMAKYGEKFTIQRRIGHKTNSWSIRNADKRATISTSKSDVAHICHALGFQPDNILVMLNQENAKQFLVGATPRAKYDQLDKALAISSQYDTIRELEQAFGQFKRQYEVQLERKNVLDAERAHAQAWISKAEAEQTAADVAEEYESVLAWRKVQTAESILATAEAKHGEAVATYEQVQKEQAEAEAAPATEGTQILCDRRDALQAEADQYNMRAEESEAAATQLMIKVKTLQEAKKEAEKKWATSKRALNEMQAAKPSETDTTDLKRQLEVSRQQLPLVSSKLGDDRDALERLQSSLEEAKDEQRSAETQLEGARKTLKATQRDSSNAATSGAQDPLTGFGANGHLYRSLNAAIDRYKNWSSQPPVGPLLAHVRASPNCDRAAVNWAEMQLTQQAATYWVRSVQDQRKLRSMPEYQKCRNVGIIVWNPELFSYSKPQARASSARTFFDAVKIENPHIERLLVDHLKVEDMLFCDSSETATRELDAGAVSSTFFADSNGWRKLTRRGNTFDSLYINKRGDQVKLQVAATSRAEIMETFKQRIEEEQEQVRHLEQRVQRAREKVQSYKRDVSSREREIEVQKRELARLQADVDLKTKKIEAAEKEPEEEQNEFLVEDLRKQLRRDESAYRNLDPQIERAEKPVILKKGEVTEFRLESAQLLKKVAELDKEITRERQRQHTRARELEGLVHKRHTAQYNLEQAANDVDVRRTHLENVLATTRAEHGERPNLANYTKSDGEMSRAIQDIRAKAGQLEQLATELEQRVQKRDRLSAEIQAYEATSDRKAQRVREYSSHMNSRKSSMKGSLNTILGRIAKDYKVFIAERGFTGQLEVNPTERRLVASANPSAGASDRSASTLSGGEKSYTQISLLLSVWNNINTGLVAMDEYDVFMDEQFRAASMEALIRTITGKPAQGILITPQGLPRAVYEKYKDSDKFKVHNLEAPRP